MWSYIVIFTQLYLGFVPWKYDCVSQMVRIIGPLPKQWKGHYNAFGSCNDDSWYDQDNKPHRSLGTIVMRARPDISPTELNHVLSIMSKGFSYLPENRLSATQLLQDSSFKAVMDIYCG